MGDSEFEDWARLDAKQLFGSAGAAILGMRLRIEREVVVSVEDLHAPLQEARRLVENRKFRAAFAKCDRVHRELGMRIRRWEAVAEARLEAMKQSRKPAKIQQLKMEIADVRRQSHGVFRLLSRLRDSLEVMGH